MQERKRTGFYKGLPGYTRASEEQLASDVEGSIYYWWWAYMRLSPVFWYANQTGRLPTGNVAVADTYAKVGDLMLTRFGSWWYETGAQLFAESKRPNSVRVLDLEHPTDMELYEKSFVVEVPLNISRETILKQFKRLLASKHEGQSLNPASATTAELKLHTKRYQLNAIKNQYWVLLYRLLYPNIANWRIGDRLRIAPHHRVRGVERGATGGAKGFDNLHSLTGRYLYKAQYLRYNAEEGSFPNFDKPVERVSLFGEKWQADFEEATRLSKGEKSVWQRWLREKFGAELRSEIVKRNRLEDQVRLPDSPARKRLPAFIDGRSDEI